MRREDGEELHVEVRCWERAQAAAEWAAHADALAEIAGQGPCRCFEVVRRGKGEERVATDLAATPG